MAKWLWANVLSPVIVVAVSPVVALPVVTVAPLAAAAGIALPAIIPNAPAAAVAPRRRKPLRLLRAGSA